jgi:hypothetical protein
VPVPVPVPVAEADEVAEPLVDALEDPAPASDAAQ